jgi:hypothetical protein
MKTKNSRMRLVKLPSDMELVLYLIREELKSTKFFSSLASVGLDDCFYQAHFGPVILGYMGFDEISDELQEFYGDLIDRHGQKIEEDNTMITACAVEVYEEILIERKKRCGDLED